MGAFKTPENWDNWPIIDVMTGGVKMKAKRDPETNHIYLLDEHGEWNGKMGSAVKKPAGNAEPSQNSENGEETDVAATANKKAKKKVKTNPILIVIIIVLSVLLLVKGNGGTSKEKTYEVIIAMQNIQPGESVSGKLSTATITETEYRKYIAEGGLYKPSEYEQIKFYVATAFIPQDGCITYANISETYHKTNPWKEDNTNTLITIPISCSTSNLGTFIWGNKITLKVTTRKTLSNKDYSSGSRPNAPDASVSSKLETIQIDTYTLKDLTIIDVLNSEQNSLYSRFSSMAAIPELYQQNCVKSRYTSLASVESDRPAYIVVAIPTSMSEWWRQINSSLYTRSYEVKQTGKDCKTQLQADAYTILSNVVNVIKPIWKNIEEAA